MSVGAADIAQAVVALWDTAVGLDGQFTQHWASSDVGNYPVLHDMEAGPQQPFPYCIFMLPALEVTTRMSGIETERREVREAPLEFHVQAKATDDDDAKTVAAGLVDAIMARFGGHPEDTPGTMTLAHGSVLIAQYTTDFGVRTGDDEYQWNINYILHVDVPVAA